MDTNPDTELIAKAQAHEQGRLDYFIRDYLKNRVVELQVELSKRDQTIKKLTEDNGTTAD